MAAISGFSPASLPVQASSVSATSNDADSDDSTDTSTSATSSPTSPYLANPTDTMGNNVNTTA